MKTWLVVLLFILSPCLVLADPAVVPPTSQTPSPYAIPQADSDGSIGSWVTPHVGEGVTGAWGPPTTVTISGGVAALSGSGYYLIDTEASAAEDDLTQITGLSNGDEVLLAPANDARTVILRAGTYFQTRVDFTMNNSYDRLRLQSVGSDTCVELGRWSGGD